MDPKTKATLSLVAAIALCGCPGLASFCMGGMFAVVSFMPNAEIDVFGSSDPQSALLAGIVMLVMGLVGLAVAALVVRSVRAKQAITR